MRQPVKLIRKLHVRFYSHCPFKKADKATSPRLGEVAVDFQGEILYIA